MNETVHPQNVCLQNAPPDRKRTLYQWAMDAIHICGLVLFKNARTFMFWRIFSKCLAHFLQRSCFKSFSSYDKREPMDIMTFYRYTRDNLEIKKSLDLHEKSLDLSNYEIFPHKILKSRTFKKSSILIVIKYSCKQAQRDLCKSMIGFCPERPERGGPRVQVQHGHWLLLRWKVNGGVLWEDGTSGNEGIGQNYYIFEKWWKCTFKKFLISRQKCHGSATLHRKRLH